MADMDLKLQPTSIARQPESCVLQCAGARLACNFCLRRQTLVEVSAT